MMIDINGRDVLIVGGGNVASRRADTLLRCGAVITAISPEFSQNFPEVSRRITRNFTPEDITANYALIFAATNSRAVNSLIHSLAQSLKIPVNVCDSQAECDFFFPSLINYENVAVSVCSAGISAGLTRRLSDKLRRVWQSWVIKEISSVL